MDADNADGDPGAAVGLADCAAGNDPQKEIGMKRMQRMPKRIFMAVTALCDPAW